MKTGVRVEGWRALKKTVEADGFGGIRRGLLWSSQEGAARLRRRGRSTYP